MITNKDIKDILKLLSIVGSHLRAVPTEYEQGFYAGIKVAGHLVAKIDKIKLLELDNDN